MAEIKLPNVLKRIIAVRLGLTNANLKKTGENKHLKYNYFELEDFLPELVSLSNEHGIATMFTMNNNTATLQIINADNPGDDWKFTIPVAESKVQGGSAIQNLGSQITYLRRYLLMTAFEISEASIVEKETGKGKAKETLTLTKDEIDKIKAPKNLEDLSVVCKDLIKIKGIKYKSAVLKEYTSCKEELEGKNENS